MHILNDFGRREGIITFAYGGSVPDVISSRKGNLLEEITLNHRTYFICLFKKAYCYIGAFKTGRHFFAKEHAGTRTHHLHIFPLEGFYERNELLFRDYLRAHPDFVIEYGELKRKLAEEYPSDPEGYMRAKTDFFIQRVVDLVRTERGLPLQNVWVD